MSKINKSKKNPTSRVQAKEVENKKEQEMRSDIPSSAEVLTTFNSWFAEAQKKIPKCHKKDIIWADFKARGIKEKETKKTFNNALKSYGSIV